MNVVRLPLTCAALLLVLGCGSLGPTSDGSAPLVAIVSPLPDALVGRQVLIEANAVDDIGVDKVRFLYSVPPSANLTLIGQVLSPPYRLTWGNGSLPDGSVVRLRVEASDVAKNIAFSEITVTISVTHGAP